MRRYLPQDEALLFIDMFTGKAVPLAVTSSTSRSRDPDDDAFLNLAIEGRADWLVTGDQDLLVLGKVEDTRIVTPAAFLEEIGPTATPKT